jgi:hypothetical protein
MLKMTDSKDLDHIEELVKAAAEESGSMILEVAISAENVPTVGLPADQFPT